MRPEQGIAGGPQQQLLALSLSALERQIAALPAGAQRASVAEWRLMVSAMLASCSVAAAQAWLGYTPSDLQLQAAAMVDRLKSGLSRTTAARVALLRFGMPATCPCMPTVTG